jgi:hypothetical protein
MAIAATKFDSRLEGCYHRGTSTLHPRSAGSILLRGCMTWGRYFFGYLGGTGLQGAKRRRANLWVMLLDGVLVIAHYKRLNVSRKALRGVTD